MNILYVITSYVPSIGGAQIHLHSLAKWFSNKHNVEVVTQLDRAAEKWLFDTTIFAPYKNNSYYLDYIPIRQVNFSFLNRVTLFPFIIPYYFTQGISSNVLSKNLFRKINDRVMMDEINIVHSSKTGREYLSLAAFKLAKYLKVPFVFTANHHPRWEGWLHRTYLDICRKADALITLTNSERDKFIKLGVEKSRIHVTGIAPVVSDQYDVEQFRRKYKVNNEMILFLGQKNEYKGLDVLVKAANIVWKKFPEAKFFFIGPRTNYSRNLFKQLQHNPNVAEIDSVSIEEKTSALAACDLLCLPSSQESFGGVFLEAWQFSKPVIGTDIYSIKDVIDDGKDGFIIKRNERQLADKIICLLDNPKLRETMGKCGYEKIKSIYNWNNIARLTEEVYKSLV